MEQINSDFPQRGKEKERRFRPLFLLILFLAMITTCIVGFILGRSVSPAPLGQLIDTILLSPEEQTVKTAAHLTGRVLYADSSPAAGLRLELHSDPIPAVTDTDGRFLFPNVPFGEHRIIAYHPDGSLAAEQSVSIRKGEEGQGVEIVKEDGGCTITIAVDIRMLEIIIQLEDGKITILSDEFSYADDHGRIITPGGTASVKDGVIVTPAGTVCLPDGRIVIPGGGDNAAVILPDDTVVYPDKKMEGDGYAIEPDGTVNLTDGTEIKPGGQIVTPEGTEHPPGHSGIIVNGGTVTPIGGTLTGNGSAPPDSSVTTPGGSTLPDSGNTLPGSNTSLPGGSEVPPGGSDTPPVGSGPSDDGEGDGQPSAGGSLTVFGENKEGSYVRWEQSSDIDLFYNRTSGAQEKIAPGSSGYYQFRLKNTRHSRLKIRLTLSEKELHLPLRFTVTSLDGDGHPAGEPSVSGYLPAEGSLVLETGIDGETAVTYRLDWEWPAEGGDALDTQIGMGENLVYLLSMDIRAEEV